MWLWRRFISSAVASGAAVFFAAIGLYLSLTLTKIIQAEALLQVQPGFNGKHGGSTSSSTRTRTTTLRLYYSSSSSSSNIDTLSDDNHNYQNNISSTRRDVLHKSAVATAGLLLPTSSTADATNSINPIVTLRDGTKFPLASFGLQIYNDETAYKLTLTALEVGYRNFFASVLANNQKGFARAIKDSNIDRQELFICGSVVSNRANTYQNAYDSTYKGWKQNMDAFSVGGIDYLDQIMLDYPGPDAASIQGQWSAFQAMHSQGLTKTLSVSNFSPTQLDAILLKPERTSNSDPKYELQVKPVVNQLPYSVAYHPDESVTENKKRGILVQAWAPLGKSLGGRFNSSMKGRCAEIGRKYNKSYAQVALRWIVQTGASFTTQSQNKDHFQQDLNIFDFELSQDDMTQLSSLA